MIQPDFFDTEETIKKKIEVHTEQMSFLPANPLQERFGQENPVLTPCEYEIMQLVLQGYSIIDLSIKFFISDHAVKWRLSNVYWKFGVFNRLGLIKKASIKALHFMVREFDKKTKETTLTKHTFHNDVNLRAHERIIENES
jgi:ATP/maltotriose-dependent transcriptional regulator MalT